MEPEIELERFAAICAEVEAGKPLEDLLSAEGLSKDTWSASRDTWMERMSREAEPERKALEARYKAAFEARKRVIEALAKGDAQGVDDAPTPPRAQALAAIGLMDTVPMLPSADPEQLLARLRARRAAAAAAQAGTSEPPPPLPAPGETTPPMRPRAALVADETAKAASEAMAPARQALPPPAAAPKPPAALPPPAPLPPPPPPRASAPLARPAPPPGYAATNTHAAPPAGGYPAVGAPPPPPAVPPAPSSSPGASGPGPGAQAAPISLAGFSAMASGPRLTLERYAAFAAEIAVHPAQLADIRTKYGLNDTGHTAETEAWQRRFSADRETYVRYATLYQHYRDWFSARGPR